MEVKEGHGLECKTGEIRGTKIGEKMRVGGAGMLLGVGMRNDWHQRLSIAKKPGRKSGRLGGGDTNCFHR